MSAWMVSTRHIDAILTWAAAHRLVPDKAPWLTGTGRVLLRECARSVNHRYPNMAPEARVPMPHYLFTRYNAVLSPIEAVVALVCYDYQSSETSDYANTAAAKLIQPMLDHAMATYFPDHKGPTSNLPGWSAVAWGID